MAITDKNTLKGWFQNGDYPNQEQFWQWMDSYWHKSESIPIDLIQGLAALLAGKATQADIDNLNQRIDELEIGGGTPFIETVVYETDGIYEIADAVLLEKLVVIPTDNISLSIGTAPLSMDIMIEQPCAADKGTPLGIDVYGTQTIYINGITAQTTIKFYKR